MASTTVGTGTYTYEVDKQWGRGSGGLPEFGLVSGVAGDSQDRVYLFIRRPVAEILVLDPRGNLLAAGATGQFQSRTCSSSTPRRAVCHRYQRAYRYAVDTGRQTAAGVGHARADRRGRRCHSTDPPEPWPTADGELYVSDGYGQQRVHRFGADGR